MKEGATIADIAARHGIHPNQVGDWKKQAIEGLVEVFSGKAGRKDTCHEAQVKELHAKIGGSQFTSMEFTQTLKDADVSISMDGKGRWMDNIMILSED